MLLSHYGDLCLANGNVACSGYRTNGRTNDGAAYRYVYYGFGRKLSGDSNNIIFTVSCCSGTQAGFGASVSASAVIDLSCDHPALESRWALSDEAETVNSMA